MVSGKPHNVAYLAAPDWTMLDDGTFVSTDVFLSLIWQSRKKWTPKISP
jgi:hypothetical protein